ncbi:sulfate ABC transporter ATP-binding protein [Pelistega indica]|uniref:Sulfate ABC transporter ATP-binding protein n=1 Tax=Pelistega indica TaxID=1414851 RepID=V8FQU0_9BURK|nr:MULTISPECIES: sulfate/molybdate ABC transporter ATP-binding protein [Pelistega]ETD66664.1 sulfate ABC transporter ATP-binding protein [Pelistega indica]
MSIHVNHIEKYFGNFHALKNISLTVQTGSLVSLLGPSGCGKTTLLRIIAGLEFADSGQVVLNGKDVTDKKVQDRKIGFMFQSYALFRHMSVFDNVAFGLTVLPKAIRPSKDEIHQRVMDLLRLIQLPHLAKAFPHQLSGGQRQRVALARSLAVKPSILLLDEPFGALDAKVRKELRLWLRDIHHELNITSLLVTHDQEEALEISDQIVVMNHGQIEQLGDAAELYHQPKTPFVTEFIGEVSKFTGIVEQGIWRYGKFEYPLSITQNTSVIGYVRPHEWRVNKENSGGSMLEVEIKHIHHVGALIRLTVLDLLTPHFHEVIVSPDEEGHYVLGQKLFLIPKNIQFFTD